MGKTNRFFLTRMIGTIGRAVSTLNPEGTVKIQRELWQAIATGAPINPGEEITVIEQKRLTLTVARRNNAEGIFSPEEGIQTLQSVLTMKKYR